MTVPNVAHLTYAIYKAIEEMGSDESLALLGKLAGQAPAHYKKHLELEHSTPSPSGITRCRLQQWYKAREEESDVILPAAWKKRSAAGVFMEPYWMSVLSLTGLKIADAEANECGPHMRAHADAFINDDGLLELKDKTGWAYKRLIEGKGLAYEQPDEYMQAQLYLHATAREWCLYLASPADPAFLQSIMQGWKKYGQNYELPLVYLAVIERREQDIQAGLERAEMIAADVQEDTPPPREFDGVYLSKTGKKAFPCGYCLYNRQCVEVYG
jgi:hypothetical protein